MSYGRLGGVSAGRWALVVGLWLVNIVSALAVVAVTQEVRRDTNELEALRRESADLEVQWGQYLLEQSTWASYTRVEKQASEQLGMKVPDASQIILIEKEH
ncbi:cell division protein FtsL [Gilvimarinus agarilyticus]|uniref:cell division protein FtsL n=1 Tax=Gilvimarinus agarilyticus TaxID=679259 RepID=UPI00069688A4|nr:cell division protein FtsL [Gilvimarinus agarilyticus]